MLWLGLYLPRLPLEVFERTLEHDGSARSQGPAALKPARVTPARTTSAHATLPRPTPLLPLLQLALCDRLHVLLANAGAQTLGIHIGCKRATALALAPDLIILERDPIRERHALEQIACWMLQFTPSISLLAPAAEQVQGLAKPHPAKGPAAAATASKSRRSRALLPRYGLLLEVEPSLHLFGGLDALVTAIKAGLQALGFSGQVSCAPTARGAWLLSNHSDGALALDPAQLNSRLAALPLELLDAAAPHHDTFESIGIRTIKELQLLPRAGLARRFGHELLSEIDQALGKKADPRRWFEAPASYSARLELLADIDNAEALLFAARRMLMQMAGWLSGLHAAARSFELLGEHDDRPPTGLAIRMTEPSRDLDRMAGLLRERLAVTKLLAPVHTLLLICGEVVPLSLPNQELFPTPRSAQENLGRLIERLQARLGRAQIQRLSLANDHRPEAAYRLEEIDRLDPAQPAPAAAIFVTSLPRPLWLLPAPKPISERNNRPYWGSALHLLAGPERIESGWWDGALVQRDYFIAEDEANVLYWIYRERLGSSKPGEGWFMQGRFG